MGLEIGDCEEGLVGEERERERARDIKCPIPRDLKEPLGWRDSSFR